MTVDQTNLYGQVANDGNIDVIDSYTIAQGEIWYLADYAGVVVTGNSSSGNTYTHEIQVTDPNGMTRLATEVVDAYTHKGDGVISGQVGSYAYQGETVQLVEGADAGTGEIETTFFARRVY